MQHINSSNKGYIHVRIPNFKKYMDFDSLSHFDIFSNANYNGILSFSVECLSPITFTQNEIISTENGDLAIAFFQENGKVVIPGSSLKGSVRTYAEFLSNSCLEYGSASCNKKRGLCIVCSTFGTLYKLGRVQFNDTFLDIKTEFEKGPVTWSGKSNNGSLGKIYSHKLKEQSIGNNEIYYEVIPAGTTFNFEITVKGLSESELGLLFLALGLSHKHRFAIKIGRGKNIGFGSVLVTPKSFKKIKGGMEKSSFIVGNQFNQLINDCINSYIRQIENDTLIMNNLEKITADSQGVLNSAR